MNDYIPSALLITTLPLIFIAAVFFVAPRTRRGVFFGVSVPVEFADSIRARHLLRNFRISICLLTIVCLSCAVFGTTQTELWFPIAATPIQLAGIYLLWIQERKQVKPFEVSVPVERTANLANNEAHGSVWLILLLLALAPLAATWLYLRAHWTEIPRRFPIHWGTNGLPNGFGSRTTLSVAMPLILGAATILLIMGVALFFRLAPVVNRERSLTVMQPVLSAIAWSLSLLFCTVALMPLLSQTSLAPHANALFLFVTIATVLCVFTVCAWMIYRLKQTQGRDNYDGTPDKAWHANGLIYFNPSDSAVLVPKRFGWGWTLNFARTAAWVYLGLVLAFAAGLSIMVSLLK